MVLFVSYVVLRLSLWMKLYGLAIEMKPLKQYFHTVPFILIVCSSKFGSVDEILCNHSNETSSTLANDPGSI